MAEETEGISNGEMKMDLFDWKSSAEVFTVQQSHAMFCVFSLDKMIHQKHYCCSVYISPNSTNPPKAKTSTFPLFLGSSYNHNWILYHYPTLHHKSSYLSNPTPKIYKNNC